MLSNTKLPPYKWAIVYFNRFIPMLIAFIGFAYFMVQSYSIGGVYVRHFFTYCILIIASFILKEVLYQGREHIYKQGESRFYLLIIVFYAALFLNVFVFHDFSKDIMRWSVETWRENMAAFNPLQYVDVTILVFSPTLAVIWYLFDVELDRSKRRDMDIKALLINENDIKRWNQPIVDISALFFAMVMLLYYLPLGVVCIIHFCVTRNLGKDKRQWVNAATGGILIALAWNFDINVINSAFAWLNFGAHFGWGKMVKEEFSLSPLNHGITLLAGFYYLVAAFAELRLKRTDIANISKISNQRQINNTFDGEIPFGIREDNSKEIRLTDDEFNYHALYLGTTGAGKTTAILNNIEHCAQIGLPCVMLDGKGSPDLPEKIKKIADKYGRTFKLFTLKPETAGEFAKHIAAYHPFSTGTFTEFKNRIMSLFSAAEGRGQQHYVIGEENAINIILAVLAKSGHDFDLNTLYQVVQDPEVLKTLAMQIDDKDLLKEIEEMDGEKIGDVGKVLKLFIISSFGHLFDTKAADSVIKLQESIINNEIVLFMFDSSTYKEDTKKIAKLVINDINSAFATMKDNIGDIKPCYCIFDEFASYASSNLADTLTLHRSNGMHAIVGTQGLETASLANSESARVAEELVACCGTFLILQLQHEKDIERVANLIGTKESYEVTRQLDISEGQGATGMGSSKQVNEYIIHPSIIRGLHGKDGTGILYRKAFKQAPYKIVLRRINFD